MLLPIERFLTSKNISYTLVELADISFTVDDVLRLSKGKLKKEEVCKTIIIRGRKTEQLIGILLRGEDRLDFKKVKRFLGEEVAIASADEVKEVSGVEPGAVCPFLLSCPLFVEERMRELSTFNCGSGHHLYGLECAVEDIEKGVASTVISVRKG
jgi:prolyl-tRNA editing enzyme YbaK/EbsC (Cys-tRNA(Pro) deacylase)